MAKVQAKGSKGLSLRAFATRHGVRDNAIRKAIAAGRLLKSVGRHANGHPFIADVELADAEWNVNRAQAPKAQIIGADTLAAAQRSATLERSRKLKIENDRTEGRLIDVDKASKLAFEASRTIRKAVQNIPSRIAAELAAESDPARVYSKLETALREALNVAATDLMAVGE
jgi:hypothetical protein